MAEALSPGLKFIYVPARDLTSMQRFYGEFLGLTEIHADDDAVSYDCHGLQFTIYVAPNVADAPEEWATQPGWTGDTTPLISWSVELNQEAFVRAIHAIRLSTQRSLHDRPQWVGYWSFPVKDPMGNTVEITWPPGRPPKSTAWQERTG